MTDLTIVSVVRTHLLAWCRQAGSQPSEYMLTCAISDRSPALSRPGIFDNSDEHRGGMLHPSSCMMQDGLSCILLSRRLNANYKQTSFARKLKTAEATPSLTRQGSLR